MQGLLQDIRHALRGFRRKPGFTAIVVATVALGVGANAAIFSVVDSILFRPLPIAQASRIVRLHDTRRSPDGTDTRFNITEGHFLEIARRSRSFDRIAAQTGETRALQGSGAPEKVQVVLTSPGTWSLYGIAPVLGRLFTPEEENAGDHAALISHDLWMRRFGGDRRVLGRSLVLEDRVLTVVGVLPEGFRFPYDASIWQPARLREDGNREWAVFARRKPSLTVDAARAELATVGESMRRTVPGTGPGYGIAVDDFRESLQDNRARVALLLLALVGFFLLIACANAAILLLARSLGMARELAIRSALGASMARQGRRLVTESVVLALAGGVAGVLLGAFLDRFLRVLIPSNLTEQLGLPAGGLDGRIFAFGAAASLLVGALAGIVPLLRLSGGDRLSLLRAGSRGGDARRDRRLFSALAAGEIALSMALLFGAWSMVRQFRGLSRQNLGFDPTRVWTARLTIPPRFRTAEERERYLEGALREAGAVAGVTAAAASTVNPLGPGGTWENPVLSGDAPPSAGAYSVNTRFVTPAFFDAMGIPLLAGRPFSSLDGRDGAPVAVVSARLARRLWPRGSAIGRRIRRDGVSESWRTVVGIARDVADSGDLSGTWYLPFAQEAGIAGAEDLHLMVRAGTGFAGVSRAVEAAIHRFDPGVPVSDSARMDRVRSDALAQERLGAIAVTLFAGLGLLLAELGTFGIVSYAVSRRSREFAVRLAIGAAPRRLLRGVLGEGLRVAAWGIAVGSGIAVAAAPAIASLSGTSGAPLLPFLGVSAALTAAITILAAAIPARRASGVDPASVLREE